MQECQASPAKHCNDVLYPNRNPALILLSSWQVLQRDWASSWTCSKQDALQATHYHLLGYTKNYNETQGCVSWFCSTIAHNATKSNTIRQPYKFTPKVNSMLVIWWVTAILLTFLTALFFSGLSPMALLSQVYYRHWFCLCEKESHSAIEIVSTRLLKSSEEKVTFFFKEWKAGNPRFNPWLT